jgi:hypothetical protein
MDCGLLMDYRFKSIDGWALNACEKDPLPAL